MPIYEINLDARVSNIPCYFAVEQITKQTEV